MTQRTAAEDVISAVIEWQEARRAFLALPPIGLDPKERIPPNVWNRLATAEQRLYALNIGRVPENRTQSIEEAGTYSLFCAYSLRSEDGGKLSARCPYISVPKD